MVSTYAKALVTGGTGFIGSHIVDMLIKADYEVIVIDDMSMGRLENLSHLNDNRNLTFIKGDIRDMDLLKEIQDVDVIFHEAAVTSAPLSLERPFETNDINLTSTLRLLQYCLDTSVKRLIYASSAAVYGEKSSQPMSEDMLLEPRTPYGVSKAASEYYMKVYQHIYGLECVCLRYFNVYGSRTREDQGVMSIFLHKLMNNERPTVFGDGEQSLDYIYVDDIVEANRLALSSEKAVGESINVGSGVATSVNQLLGYFKEILEKKWVEPLYEDPRPGDVKLGYADTKKAKELLSFEAEISMKEGISKLVRWYKQSGR